MLEARPGQDRFDKVEAMSGVLAGSKAVFRGIAKELVIAYNHGWDVVHELHGLTYTETEEERKALKQAVKSAASKKPKPTKPQCVQPASATAIAAKVSPAGGVTRVRVGTLRKGV